MVRYPNIYTVYDTYATITISGGKYEGTIIYIDIEDVEKCKQHQWSVAEYGLCKKKYVSNPRKKLLLHRYLMDVYDDHEVDHKDGNTLDNRRKSNLRVCETRQNQKNRQDNKNNKSGHKGVYWDKHIPTPKWKAYIMVDYKYKHLGYYDRYEDAVDARLAGEKKYFGEFNQQRN